MSLLDRIKQAISPRQFFAEHWPEHFRAQGNSVCPFHGDDNASLQVDDKLAFCHGCGKSLSTIDLTMEKFGFATPKEATEFLIAYYNLEYLRRPHGPRNQQDEWICYDYNDERGRLLYQVVRKPGKNFLQRHPDPDNHGKWSWKLAGVRVCLYHLDRIVLHRESDGPIYFVEGEKDADNLNLLGLLATTSPRGAKGWRSFVEKHQGHFPLADKHVVIIPDNDQPGREYAQAVASTIQDSAASVKIVELPGLADKGDVSDFIEKHGHEEAKRMLLELVEAAPLSRSESKPSGNNDDEAIYLTDRGNAQRLAAKFGHLIRYSKHLGSTNDLGWFFFDGKRWREDILSQIQACAKSVARDLITEAFACEDEDRRKKLLTWAFRSESAGRIGSMIKLLPSEPNISVALNVFDNDPMLLNLVNGSLDLNSGTLRPHNPNDLVSKLAPVNFDPDATCPRWESFILEIMDGDEDLAAFLKRFFGYSITGITKEEVWAFLWGKGENGKSTMLNALSWCLGDYAINTSAETFMETYNRGVRTDLARLRGARLITAGEPKGNRFDAETLKAFTGQDTITARFLYAKEFEFKPEGKLFLCANHRPAVRDSSHAFWRRILLLPFTRIFTGDERDNNLEATLKAEAPGILNWLVAGCLEWQRDGLQIPEKVRIAVEDYRSETDVLADFFENRCLIAEGQSVAVKDLYREYRAFCNDRGLRGGLSRQRFNEDLMSRPGIDRARIGSQKVHTWMGIGIVNSEGASSQPSKGCEMCDLEGDGCPIGMRIRDAAQCGYFTAMQ